MKRKKEMWEYLLYAAGLVVVLMILVSSAMVATAYKIDRDITQYQKYAEKLYDENEKLKLELEEYK